ncbi:MAG: uracil-DNA glycosylase [Alphaproteobacteria bacterium]|nr:uracil-DNA glycosylase [Alphaproteobacteria bacterium]
MAGGPFYSALKWQIEAGADEAIGETPVDRFAEAPPSPPPPKVRPPAPPRQAAPSAPRAAPSSPPAAPLPAADPASQDAKAIAAGAKTLEDIRAALEAFDGCPLKRTATNLVYTDGNPAARIVLVGEAPGAEEDRRGLPFVGPAGRLLDRMLAAIGLDRSSVLITNTLFWRPPGNRNPTPAEAAACLPFVERTIEIVDPKVLVMVGGTAAKTLLARPEGIMKLRGQWFEYSTPAMARPVPAMAIFHPAFLLRSPAQKRPTWRDLIEIRKHLEDSI